MNWRFHRRLAAVLAVALPLALGGCGGGSNAKTERDEALADAVAAEKAQMEAETAKAMAEAAAKAAIAATKKAQMEAEQAQMDADAAEAKKLAADQARMEADAAKAEAEAEAKAADAAQTKAETEAEKLRMAEEKRQTDEMAAAEEAERMAMNAMAKKLHAGLGITGDGALKVTVVSMSAGMLSGKVGLADTAPSDIDLPMSGAIAPSISGWNGMDYLKTMDGVTNAAIAYTNPGTPTRQRFEKKHVGNIDVNTGHVPQSKFAKFEVTGIKFASGAGMVKHKVTDRYVSIRGTFDGASGSFRCPEACTSSVSDATGVTLSSKWYFVADDGAMTSTPDRDYIMFGWWARDTSTAVGVDTFVTKVGSAAASDDIKKLEGSATYIGGATGKVAVYSPLSDGNEAGAFTAKATLTAKFGSATVGGMISGMLTDFSVEDRANDWSVSLKETTIADNATFGGPEKRTEWTIGGTTSAESGMWEGTLYETAESSGVPMTAAGTFRSEYSTIGRMIGAFGATKE